MQVLLSQVYAIIRKFILDVHMYSDIPLIIPEFTPEFLCVNKDFGYWWEIDDTASRIVAFNKLISIYKKKCSLWDRFLALF